MAVPVQITDHLISYTYALAALGILYVAYIVLDHLYLSPLAKFPGPKLAALTFWYETYYDVLKGGCCVWKLTELHEKYG